MRLTWVRGALDVVGHSVSEYHPSDIGIIRFALCRLHFSSALRIHASYL